MENKVKKPVIMITMFITMILAAYISNKTTTAASRELGQSEFLVSEEDEKEQERQQNLAWEKEINSVSLVGEAYNSFWDEFLEKEVQEIQGIYADIQANMGSYKQAGGKYYTQSGELVRAELSTGSALDRAMNKYGYSSYQVVYYYKPSYYLDSYDGPLYIEMTVNGNQQESFYCCEHGDCQIIEGKCRGLDYFWDNVEYNKLSNLVQELKNEGTLLLRAYNGNDHWDSDNLMPPVDLTDDGSRFVGNYAIMEDAETQMSSPRRGGVFSIVKIENGKIYGSYEQNLSAIGAVGISLDFSQGVPLEHNRFTAEGFHTDVVGNDGLEYKVEEYPCKVECWFEVINGKRIIRTWDLSDLGVANIYYQEK
ncbi:hypothetical protein D7X87_10065 [bacterium D16-54]|nr:hypothetical protein D7X87_10065 [bacterium D16-54]RKJ14684.1 hypothetical protein D7X65_10660 [bacterium D16-56]